MRITRRAVIISGTATLAAPALVRAQSLTTLKFAPQSDLPSLDPVWTTADVTRNHAHLVFDTLYGMDNDFAPRPQMAAGQTVSADGREWNITLRDGLMFHDNTKVLARDAVASLRRWMKRDTFGGVLAPLVDELSAPSDTVIRFRLKKPFPLLMAALSVTTNMPAIMPERLANTDAMRQVTEMVGSGPFRFVADERIAGSRVVYAKFAGYVPRPDGAPEFTAGPKIAYFDRVEWNVVPDAATAAAALTSNEYDWWENPQIDLIPSLQKDRNITVVVKDHTGEIGCMRFNALLPPFDNPAIRRAVCSAIDQTEFMQAVAGAVPSLIKAPMGVFVPGTPLANDVGVAEHSKPRDPAEVQRDLEAAGYKGEKIVILAASNFPTITAIAQVGGDLLKKIGMNVDYQNMDWGTVVQRRASKEPVDKGGWNIFFTFLGGQGNISPASDIAIRGSGGDAWFGWPTMPRMEDIRRTWFDAPDLAAQQAACRDLQAEFWQQAPYGCLGMYDQPTAFRATLKDVREGIPQFYGVKRA
jgi:peptide/nickel transport system substrate-binding protein